MLSAPVLHAKVLNRWLKTYKSCCKIKIHIYIPTHREYHSCIYRPGRQRFGYGKCTDLGTDSKSRKC